MSIFSGLFRGGAAAVAELPYPAGSTQELAARWVRWIAAVSPLRDPIDDRTGEDAALEQPDDIWFLAGSYDGKPVTRRCDVPAGRALLVPVTVAWRHAADGPFERVAADAPSCALDGRPQRVDEVVCDRPFEVAGRLGNPVTGRRKPAAMICAGFWTRLAPPAPGSHELIFDAITYHLTVA